MSPTPPPAKSTSGTASDALFDRLLVDHESLTASIRAGETDFAAGFEGLSTSYAVVRADALSGAVLDRGGRVLRATSTFAADLGLDDEAPSIFDIGFDLDGPTIQLVHPSKAGVLSGLAVTTPARAAGWKLPPEIAAAVRLPGAAFVALMATPASTGAGFLQACAAFGLTPSQTRVARSVLLTGNIRRTATDLGIAYDSARESIIGAMRKVGVRKLPALIERLVRLSFGVWPTGDLGKAILLDCWGLTLRQATVALRVAEGMGRSETAAAIGVSDATVKAEMKVVFEVMGVQSAAGLTRVIIEAQILGLLTDATGTTSIAEAEHPEPLALARRGDDTLVAYSDYGPRSGAPVFVLHTSSACRFVPGGLVEALHAQGFRPISIDRPGFGLTDPPRDPAGWREDPFSAAAADMRLIADTLRLERVDLLCRGGAQVAIAAHRLMPGRLGRVVLINPDPPTDDRLYRGPVGAVAALFFRQPALIERVAGALSHWLGRGLGRRILQHAVADNPSDRALMADPRHLADYERGFRPFTTGQIGGYVTEQTAMTRWSSPPLAGVERWRVIQGEADWMATPGEVEAFWRGRLPGAGFRIVPGAGRFLVLSHPALVAEALRAAPAPARADVPVPA